MSVFQRILSLKGILVERVVNVVDALCMLHQLYEVEDNVHLQFHQSITHPNSKVNDCQTKKYKY